MYLVIFLYLLMRRARVYTVQRYEQMLYESNVLLTLYHCSWHALKGLQMSRTVFT